MKYSKELTALCVIVFLSLSLIHFLSPRPLDLDENSIIGNLKVRSYSGLLSELEDAQAFPRLYVFAVKFIGDATDYSIRAVRFLPLVFMWLAYFLWIRLFKKAFKDEFLSFLAILAFSCSYHLIYYSAETKPFSMDVFVIAVFLSIFLYQRETHQLSPTKITYAIAFLSPLLIFFSYTGLFAFWIVGFNYYLSVRQNKNLIPVAVINVCICIVSLIVLYMIDLRHGLNNHVLMGYWDNYFLCYKSLYCFSEPWWEGNRKIVAWWFVSHTFMLKAGTVFIPFFLYALVKHGGGFFKRDSWRVFSAEALGFILYFELIIFALLKKYPFIGTRVTLFLAPFVIIFIIRGINDLKRFRKTHLALLTYFIVFLVVGAISALCNFLNFYNVL